MTKWKSSKAGGDNGGTAAAKESKTPRIFLATASDSLMPALPALSEFLVAKLNFSEEVLLLGCSVEVMGCSLELFLEDAITERKTPDSLKPWIMDCEQKKDSFRIQAGTIFWGNDSL